MAQVLFCDICSREVKGDFYYSVRLEAQSINENVSWGVYYGDTNEQQEDLCHDCYFTLMGKIKEMKEVFRVG